MKFAATALAASLVLGLSVPAQSFASTLIDGGRYVEDTSTGLAWLKTPYLDGYSYQQVAAGELGYVTHGWRFATASEISNLFADNVSSSSPKLVNNDFYTVWSTDAFDSAYALVLLLGMNSAFNDDRATYDVLQGELHQVSSEGWIAGGGLAELTAIFGGDGATTAGRWGVAANWPDLGVAPCCTNFLVKSANFDAPIPEPSTWAFSILGLSLAGWALRTKSKRKISLS